MDSSLPTYGFDGTSTFERALAFMSSEENSSRTGVSLPTGQCGTRSANATGTEARSTNATGTEARSTNATGTEARSTSQSPIWDR